MINSYYRGHEIILNEKEWIYKDNKKPVKFYPYREYGKCGKENNKNDHDACISNLPGVINACCGHGTEEGYIQFENGVIIRGKFKIEDSEVL